MASPASSPFVRAGLAALATFIGGLAGALGGERLPGAVAIGALALAFAFVRRDEEGAVAWSPVSVIVAAYAYFEVARAHLNATETIERVLSVVGTSIATVAATVMVAGAGVVTLSVGARGARVAFAIGGAAATLLLAVAIATAVRHPTERAFVLRMPVVADMPAFSPAAEELGYGGIADEHRATACGLRMRQVQLSKSCVLSVAIANTPLEDVRPEVRGEPGDYGDVVDYCKRTIVRCDATSQLVVADVGGTYVVFDGPARGPRTQLPRAVLGASAPPHAWWAFSAVALGAAAAAALRRRFALAALAAWLSAAPLGVALALGAIGLR